MGFLKSLIKSAINAEYSPQIDVKVIAPNRDTQTIRVSSEVQELVMLKLVERFKVGDNSFPQYLQYNYGIAFPKETIDTLYKKGLIRTATPKETLTNLKVAELKEIASQFGIKSTGKKDELCGRIAENVTDADLDSVLHDKYWKITDKGIELLDQNPHIAFYLEKHPYVLSEIGFDINKYAALFPKTNTRNVRDTLWGEFNRMSMELFADGLKSGEFYPYCSLLRTMALFLEEEGKHQTALRDYLRYLFYSVNYRGALSAINYYKMTKDYNQAESILCTNVEIYPFMCTELLAISNECGFDSVQLQSFMKEIFAKDNNPRYYTDDELIALIMAGLRKDKEEQNRISKAVLKRYK